MAAPLCVHAASVVVSKHFVSVVSYVASVSL